MMMTAPTIGCRHGAKTARRFAEIQSGVCFLFEQIEEWGVAMDASESKTVCSRLSYCLIGAFLTASAAAPTAQADIRIHAELDRYEVTPGEVFDIRVYLDADDSLPGDQTLPNGLFSYGVKLEFDPDRLTLVGADAIQVPDALNFNGFSAGAARQTGVGFGAVKGNIDQVGADPYAGSLIASFRVSDTSAGGAYEVRLSPHRTLGPSEQLFVDGAGEVLDAQMQFGTAQIVAVPEPSMAWMLLAGLGVLACGAYRKRLA
jgi:hypothetical protein